MVIFCLIQWLYMVNFLKIATFFSDPSGIDDWAEILGASFLLRKAGNPWLKSPKIATHGAGICTPTWLGDVMLGSHVGVHIPAPWVAYGYLVGGLEHFDYFSISWECHHPNWRTHIFQRGRLKPPTRYGWNSTVWSVAFSQRFSAEVFPDSRRRTGVSNRESSPTTLLKIWEMMINQWMLNYEGFPFSQNNNWVLSENMAKRMSKQQNLGWWIITPMGQRDFQDLGGTLLWYAHLCEGIRN